MKTGNTFLIMAWMIFICTFLYLSKGEDKCCSKESTLVSTLGIEVSGVPVYCLEIDLERATTYYPTEAQCDSNPYTTADGSFIDMEKLHNKEIRWVALSRDLICDAERRELFPNDTNHWRGDFHFGDTITIYSKENPQVDGDWVVHDCMASKYKMSIDFLMHPENNYPKMGVGTDVKIVYCGIIY